MVFDTGVPDRSLIVTPYGVCQMARFHENGQVDLYMGNGRTFTVSGKTRWRYLSYPP